MLGRSHVITGAAGATLALAAIPSFTNDIPTTVAAATLITGGAIMPDLDHPGATVARTLAPIGRGLSRIVSAVSGGHRKGSHGVLGWLVFAVVAVVVSLWSITVGDVTFAGHTWHIGTLHVGLGLLCGLCAAVSLTALHLDPFGAPSWLVAIVAATITATGSVEPLVAGVCMFIGCMIHSVFGDALTTERVPFLYPFSKRRLGIPILGKTGSGRETVYVGLVVVGIVVIAVLFLR